MQEFSNAMRNRFRFHNDRMFQFDGQDHKLRIVVQFTHYGWNAGKELGLGFELFIAGSGFWVDGVVWIDHAGTVPEAIIATENVISFDREYGQDLIQFVKNTALSIHHDVLEMTAPHAS